MLYIGLYKIRLKFVLIVIVFYHTLTFAAGCVDLQIYQSVMMEYAFKEADIANIPRFKAGMLVDKADFYGKTNDKLSLIVKYNNAHGKPQLSEEQIVQINEIELEKQDYTKGHVICK